MSAVPGALYLLPTLLGDCAPERVLPASTLAVARRTEFFLAESAKTARAFLKAIDHPQPIASLTIVDIGHQPDFRLIDEWLDPARQGRDIALVSEAGCPGVADPGAEIVARAHALRLPVRPLVGPSSILLALMASGMNGQHFRFVGYLPQDAGERTAAIGELERSSSANETQVFIETPYRNERLLQALLEVCQLDTRLAVAIDLTTDAEQIVALTVQQWRAMALGDRPRLARRPAIFALLARPATQTAERVTSRRRIAPSGRQ